LIGIASRPGFWFGFPKKGFKKIMRTLRLFLLCILATQLISATATRAQQWAAPFAAPRVRIVNRIDDADRVTLKGNTHPAANAKNDRGLVSSSLPMTDLILVLSRDPVQQAAFDQFVAGQYDPNSPDFHHWLTPQQVGQNFGPSESDVATVTNWLTGHGFAVTEVSNDRLSIRFNGTAATVQSAFHTEIHNLTVGGVVHIGNMSDPQIPAAISPVVVGVKSLHNFFPRPMHRMGSQVTLSRDAGGWQRAAGPRESAQHFNGAAKSANAVPEHNPASQFTINVPATGGTDGTPAYTEEDISPYDFATIYNVLPLWNKGIDGTGQTIAIAGTSDISQNDISTFRTFFGLPTNLPANTPQLVHPNPSLPGGDDPGICTSTTSTICSVDDLIENSLDVEWSGSVAKNAQIILVTAASQSATDDTLYDAESYIVNNTTAHILSVSYGNCELALGTSGNAEYNTLWQNAASEGIAVFVAAGDSGSASCDQGGDDGGSNLPYAAEYGLSVSGIASTPYNTAVGGTDFNWCSMTSTSACTPAPLWNPTNSTIGASAVGYVPEMPWNDTCTSPFALAWMESFWSGTYTVTDAESGCNAFVEYASELEQGGQGSLLYLVDTVGGSGGASSCTTNNTVATGTTIGTVASCSGGYAKPAWQTGAPGIPSDGKRDLPDVSFFSSDGFLSDSAYLICVASAYDSEPCSYSTDAEPFASEVGGTSASTPPMAGVMALINQKTGAPQGFANPELYKLAAKQTYSNCSAESVTTGGSCYFNDIDAGPFSAPGTNAMPCDYTDASPNCTVIHSGDEVGVLPGYNAGTGFDLATGLGSLNVANVVNAWPAASGGSAVSVTVTPAQTSIILTATLGVTGTVASSATGGATPTGSVTIVAGTYSATATLSGTGTYSFTVPASSLGAGTDTITVAYGGSSTYSTASGQAVVSVLSGGATFSLTGTAIAYTPSTASTTGIAPGGSASAAVTVSAVNGYTGSVTLSCSLTSSPTNATDAPSCTGGGPSLGATLPSTTPQVISFTVTTTAASTTTVEDFKRRVASQHSNWNGAGGGAVLALVLFLGIPARRRSWRAMLGMLIVMAAMGSMAACGGGGGGGGGTTTETDPGTSAGTYMFTVQAVGTPSVSPSVSTTFTVVVN
jgi:subtilase family serine protease